MTAPDLRQPGEDRASRFALDSIVESMTDLSNRLYRYPAARAVAADGRSDRFG